MAYKVGARVCLEGRRCMPLRIWVAVGAGLTPPSGGTVKRLEGPPVMGLHATTVTGLQFESPLTEAETNHPTPCPYTRTHCQSPDRVR